MILPKHLGGHGNITHVDKGALLYLKDKFDIKIMIDVGCGVGGMLQVAKRYGVLAAGIDGDYTAKRPKELEKFITIHDFTKGESGIKIIYELAWSVEFLEHIEEQYLPNVFDTFKLAQYVFCTANPYRNKYHFNPQPVSYWIKKFEENGFKFLEKETQEIRLASTMNRNFVRETGMVFKNIKL